MLLISDSDLVDRRAARASTSVGLVSVRVTGNDAAWSVARRRHTRLIEFIGLTF